MKTDGQKRVTARWTIVEPSGDRSIVSMAVVVPDIGAAFKQALQWMNDTSTYGSRPVIRIEDYSQQGA